MSGRYRISWETTTGSIWGEMEMEGQLALIPVEDEAENDQ